MLHTLAHYSPIHAAEILNHLGASLHESRLTRELSEEEHHVLTELQDRLHLDSNDHSRYAREALVSELYREVDEYLGRRTEGPEQSINSEQHVIRHPHHRHAILSHRYNAELDLIGKTIQFPNEEIRAIKTSEGNYPVFSSFFLRYFNTGDEGFVLIVCAKRKARIITITHVLRIYLDSEDIILEEEGSKFLREQVKALELEFTAEVLESALKDHFHGSEVIIIATDSWVFDPPDIEECDDIDIRSLLTCLALPGFEKPISQSE